ncbi:hypothetical protein F4553_007935 [Allocatelliglobosispora scoriae]|uniref:Uncharacterized protein n=1 Tax=Allocatelliglobosispora scoriae TaxID=643052 RepID=A0A841C6U4_9ACTN|nr:hypothetical protein [Allocatelliglobosispora scoriae]MBB5874501.1 hypothetical protein [Allocatelliglobosispora scoriae]
MTIRPSESWRNLVAREAAQVAEGTLAQADAYAAQLFPESLLTATDKLLARFEDEVRGLGTDPSDDDVMAAVRDVVLKLNDINDEHDGAAYETGEREQLCEYIDGFLGESGIDVEALAGRQGFGRWELTDEWRDW